MRTRNGRGDRRGEQIAALAAVGGLIQRATGRAYPLDGNVASLRGGGRLSGGRLRGGCRLILAPEGGHGPARGPAPARVPLGEWV